MSYNSNQNLYDNIETNCTRFKLPEKHRIPTPEEELILSFDTGDIVNRYSKIRSII